jgi:Domain of unknown function (DUF2019)
MTLAKAVGRAGARDVRLRNLSARKLVTAYANAATRYGRALSSYNFKEANRQADRISELYLALCERGAEGRRALLPLLNHIEFGVRLWAAAHALEFAPELAEPVLDKLMSAHGLQSQIAAATLREWHSGDLHFA